MLARLTKDISFDVMHSHNWMCVSLPRSAAPLVHTMHDYAMVCPRRTLYRWGRTSCDGPGVRKCFDCTKEEYGAVRGAAVTVGTGVGRWLARPDRLIAISEAVAAAAGPHVRQKVSVIPTAIPDVLGEDPVEGLPPIFAMYAGAPERHKGVGMLLEVWRDAPPGIPLVMAVTRGLEGFALPRDVKVMSLTRRQVFYAWRRARVAVVPSLWPEPFGTVAVEAMALGTPVVACSSGGLKEVVRDGVDGILVAPGSVDEFATALKRIVSDDVLRDGMSTAAKERSQKFRMSRVIPEVEEVYAKAIGDWRLK